MLPSDELKLVKTETEMSNEHQACLTCGNVIKKEAGTKCSNCGDNKWMEAIRLVC